MTTVGDAPRVRTYGNWVRPQSKGVLGMGTVGTVLLFAALILGVLLAMARGLLVALGYAVVVGVVFLVALARDKHGLSLWVKLGEAGRWMWRCAVGQDRYEAGPLTRVPGGRFRLPGVLAESRVFEFSDSQGRRCVLVGHPSQKTFTVVLQCSPDGVGLVDSATVDQRVARWGAWLAGLGDTPGVVSAAVHIETAPDSGERLAQEVTARMGGQGVPGFASAVLTDVVGSYPVGSTAVSAWITVTMSAVVAAGGRARSVEEVARDAASQLGVWCQKASEAGAGVVTPVTALRLAEILRTRFDPAAASLVAGARVAGSALQIDWEDAGPSSTRESWGSYRHDSGSSVSWLMTVAPLGNVTSTVLTPLLAPHPGIPVKRVTLLFSPVDPGKAPDIVEREKGAAEFAVHTSRRPTARAKTRLAKAEKTAMEEASGAGLVVFGVIVTATALQGTDTRDIAAAVEGLGAQARLRLRVAYGRQAGAFAASLPVGVWPDAYVLAPKMVKDKL